MRYVYRGYRDASNLIAVADCRIPATPAAVARMNRKLKLRPSEYPTPGGPVLASYELAPIVAIACGPGYIGEYPNCYPVHTPTTGGTTDPGGVWEEAGAAVVIRGVNHRPIPATTTQTGSSPIPFRIARGH